MFVVLFLRNILQYLHFSLFFKIFRRNFVSEWKNLVSFQSTTETWFEGMTRDCGQGNESIKLRIGISRLWFVIDLCEGEAKGVDSWERERDRGTWTERDRNGGNAVERLAILSRLGLQTPLEGFSWFEVNYTVDESWIVSLAIFSQRDKQRQTYNFSFSFSPSFRFSTLGK